MAAPPVRYTLVRKLFPVVFLVLATLVAAPSSAQSSTPAGAAKVPAPTQGDAAASEAVEVVDTFMLELGKGQLERARQLMAPEAIVLADGRVLGNRDTYIDGAAKADVAALGSVQRELMRRDAHAGPNFSWVMSELRLRGPSAARGQGDVVVETMLLARRGNGWKIVHIHWSSRRAG